MPSTLLQPPNKARKPFPNFNESSPLAYLNDLHFATVAAPMGPRTRIDGPRKGIPKCFESKVPLVKAFFALFATPGFKKESPQNFPKSTLPGNPGVGVLTLGAEKGHNHLPDKTLQFRCGSGFRKKTGCDTKLMASKGALNRPTTDIPVNNSNDNSQLS